uniref:Uncharacterized protein n=1 Tax=Salmo trutta TaxID=8032 RepID=A0A674CQZ0_SALTR
FTQFTLPSIHTVHTVFNSHKSHSSHGLQFTQSSIHTVHTVFNSHSSHCLQFTQFTRPSIHTVFNSHSVSVEELDKFLQAPEAALQAAEQELGKAILEHHLTFQLLVQVLQQNPDDLNQRQDEGAEGQGALSLLPEGSAKLLEGPVVGCEGPISTPEEEEHVVELEHDEVFMVVGLASVEGKQALGVRALGRDVGGVERLRKERGNLCDISTSAGIKGVVHLYSIYEKKKLFLNTIYR